jgi:hypothetical protein
MLNFQVLGNREGAELTSMRQQVPLNYESTCLSSLVRGDYFLKLCLPHVVLYMNLLLLMIFRAGNPNKLITDMIATKALLCHLLAMYFMSIQVMQYSYLNVDERLWLSLEFNTYNSYTHALYQLKSTFKRKEMKPVDKRVVEQWKDTSGSLSPPIPVQVTPVYFLKIIINLCLSSSQKLSVIFSPQSLNSSHSLNSKLVDSIFICDKISKWSWFMFY